MLRKKNSSEKSKMRKKLRFAAAVSVASALAIIPMLKGQANADSAASAADAVAQSNGRLLYIESNNIAEGQNAILAYQRMPDGSVKPLAHGRFLTGGTGMNNNTHGKVGPHDNDSPVIVSPDNKRLFAVNTHSNTIAVFDILEGGMLRHVNGSPFPSMGIGPNSLSLSGDVLLVANRNGDYHQLEELRGKAKANYSSFKVGADGRLTHVSTIDVEGAHKPTQVLFSQRDKTIAFGNDFEVDADFDGEGDRSWLAGTENRVQGQVHSFKVGADGSLTEVMRETIPETIPNYLYKGSPGVTSIPLGIWDHPTKNLLYVGFITRNELGVYRYDDKGMLTFVRTVPNSGQDICWVLVNKEGTRLYSVNNLPRDEYADTGSTISIYDISGKNAEKPKELGRVVLPNPGESFINNRMFSQPGSTAFQIDLDPEEKFLYVMAQRINQHEENKSEEGNILHTYAVDEKGMLSHVSARHLGQDGIPANSRPQGVVTFNQ